jgi:hypothetical protein
MLEENTVAVQDNTETATASETADTTVTAQEATGEKEAATADKSTATTKEANTEASKDLLADYKPTLPEGVELDQAAFEAAMPILKELGVSSEQADKLINLHAQTVQGVANRIVEDINATCQKNYDEIFAEIKKDKDIGEKSIGQINAMLKKYGGESEHLHTALTALAGFDKDAVKPFFTALAAIARDAADDTTVLGIPRQANGDNRWPGLK